MKHAARRKTRSPQETTRNSTRSLRFQRLDARQLLAADLMNLDNPVDVNADGSVTPGDALAVINELSDRVNGVAQGEIPADGIKLYPDTNGDSLISPADILKVLNSLAQGEQIAAPAPDLQVNNLQFDAANRRIIASAFNSSDTPVPESDNPIVRFEYFDLSDGMAVGSPVDVELESFPRDNSPRDFAPGNYRVIVTVDPASIDDVDELNEDNNVDMLDFQVLDSTDTGDGVPTVSLTSSTNSINEGDSTTLSIARTGATTSSLTVPILVTGSADLDDVMLGSTENITLTETTNAIQGSVTFPAGVSQLDIPVTAVADGLTEIGGEDFRVSISLGSGFNPDSFQSAQTILINDTSTGNGDSEPDSSSSNLTDFFGGALSAFSGGTLSVNLTADDAGVFVEVNDDGHVVVSVSDGNGDFIGQEILAVAPETVRLTISGDNNFIDFAGLIIENDLIVHMTGNGNTLVLNETRVKDDFLAYGTAGQNDFILENYTVIEDQLRFDLGAGDDFVFLDKTYVGGQVIATMGSGNDFVGILNSTIKENLKFFGGAGNDELDIVRGNVYNDMFFEGHGGNDLLSVVRSYVSDDAIINLGSGNDEVFVFGSVVHDRTRLDGQSGVDSLFANTADFITDDLDVDGIERALAATDPGTGIVAAASS